MVPNPSIALEPNVLSITLEPLDALPIDEYVSAVVISNLRYVL